MSNNNEALFEAFLNQHDDRAWAGVIRDLLPFIHDVDKNATEIWFHFYPLALSRALEQAEDRDELAQKLLLQGNYSLKGQVADSHRFLYGHRYWAEVKRAVEERAASDKAPASLELASQIREIASAVAALVKADASLLVGITAVAFLTLQHVGIDDFKASSAAVRAVKKSPERILKERARDDGQGLFGFLRGEEKVYTVTFDETDESAKFKLINSQHLTTAAAADKRDHTRRDARIKSDEGPIPVECRSASCGTCWVGVLGGAEKLSEVGALEGRRIKEFGYIATNEAKPLVRLACQAQAYGAVSIVIPPWNGVFGKHLSKQKAREQEAVGD
ncbi:MAG TPA: 2Fe-2S iron-sulfur cluster-binding protein [Blastocatellia bacterium]|nr:2Fe-2S iron-sulfur cluster-binding protein [Blastocatellia bacterium]